MCCGSSKHGISTVSRLVLYYCVPVKMDDPVVFLCGFLLTNVGLSVCLLAMLYLCFV